MKRAALLALLCVGCVTPRAPMAQYSTESLMLILSKPEPMCAGMNDICDGTNITADACREAMWCDMDRQSWQTQQLLVHDELDRRLHKRLDR